MESIVKIIALRIPEVLKNVWSEARYVADIGGGSGYVLMELLRKYPQLEGINIDLPILEEVFNHYLERESTLTAQDKNLKERVHFQALDFLKEDFNFKISDKSVQADVIMFGNVLHNWEDENKLLLLKKAYAALKPGGKLVVYDAFIDDEQVEKTPSILMSLNMQLVCKGSQFTYKQFAKWLTDVGFVNFENFHIESCHDAIVATKKNV